jgi:hypothetical protein
MLIPLFNIIWIFVIVYSIARTLKREFGTRGISTESGFGLSTGLAMSIFLVVSIIHPSTIPYPWFTYVVGLSGIGFVICWIVYWVMISCYSKKLDSQIP